MEQLMQGVTVLSKEAITKCNNKVFLTILITSILIVIIGFILALTTNMEELGAILMCIFAIIAICSHPLAEELFPIDTDKYTYKVMIDDTVSMKGINKWR